MKDAYSRFENRQHETYTPQTEEQARRQIERLREQRERFRPIVKCTVCGNDVDNTTFAIREAHKRVCAALVPTPASIVLRNHADRNRNRSEKEIEDERRRQDAASDTEVVHSKHTRPHADPNAPYNSLRITPLLVSDLTDNLQRDEDGRWIKKSEFAPTEELPDDPQAIAEAILEHSRSIARAVCVQPSENLNVWYDVRPVSEQASAKLYLMRDKGTGIPRLNKDGTYDFQTLPVGVKDYTLTLDAVPTEEMLLRWEIRGSLLRMFDGRPNNGESSLISKLSKYSCSKSDEKTSTKVRVTVKRVTAHLDKLAAINLNYDPATLLELKDALSSSAPDEEIETLVDSVRTGARNWLQARDIDTEAQTWQQCTQRHMRQLEAAYKANPRTFGITELDRERDAAALLDRVEELAGHSYFTKGDLRDDGVFGLVTWHIAQQQCSLSERDPKPLDPHPYPVDRAPDPYRREDRWLWDGVQTFDEYLKEQWDPYESRAKRALKQNADHRATGSSVPTTVESDEELITLEPIPEPLDDFDRDPLAGVGYIRERLTPKEQAIWDYRRAGEPFTSDGDRKIYDRAIERELRKLRAASDEWYESYATPEERAEVDERREYSYEYYEDADPLAFLGSSESTWNDFEEPTFRQLLKESKDKEKQCPTK